MECNNPVFIGIRVSAEIARGLQEMQESLRLSNPDLKMSWTHEADFHLTLLYLGKVDGECLEAAIEFIARNPAPTESLRLSGVGAFPNLKHPRVIVMLLEPSSDLSTYQENLSKHLSAYLSASEKHPFTPHVTLARVRAGARFRHDSETVQLEGGRNEFRPMAVELIESLPAQRPKYHTLYPAVN